MLVPRYSRRIANGLVALGVLVLALVICAPASAQVAGATLTGTLSDTSGAVIPNVQITIRDVATGVTRTLSTDSAGLYTAPNLLPGTYEVTASASGFATEVRSGITLTVGAQQELNLTLRVGQATEKVEVTGEAPAVQLAASSLSNQVSATTVRELPLNGRDWVQLATLQPGVTSTSAIQPAISGNASSARVNRGFGNGLTISGARPEQNNYRIDGVSANSYGNGSPGTVLGGSLGVDAVQEFSVLTSNYSAEYGRTSGGVVNAITRSGTNQFHGDAYEFLRNSSLDAANFFDNFNGLKKAPFRRNQFGASGGAPIRKDKTFVFGDYEGLRQSLGITNTDTVPSVNARNGILADGTTVKVDSQVAPALDLWPLPNSTIFGDTGIYSFAGQSVTSENFVTARVDHKFREQDSVFGTYQYDKALTTLPDALNAVLIGQRAFRQFIALEESHIFSPRFINTVRGGFNRETARGGYGVSAINPAAADPALAAIPGYDAPQTFVPGLTTFNGGLRNENNTTFNYNSFQGYDDAFFTKGNQSLRFGVAVERLQQNIIQDFTVGGQFRFGSLPGFLTNQPIAFQTGNLPGTHTPRGLRQTIVGTYIQDDIRWRPNLTINVGLRYEMSTVPTEVQDKLSDLPTPTATAPHLGNPLFSNPTLKNFEPRVGFAWDPFRDGKTSVRAGFGLFDVLPLLYEYQLTQISMYPFAQQGRTSDLQTGDFPSGAFGRLEANRHFRVCYIEPDPSRSYVMQWNFNIQRELMPSLTAMVAYVGSRGVHQLFRADDMNMVLPITLSPDGYLWPTPIGSGKQLNPNFGRIDHTTWGSNSFYDALQFQVLKKMSHGFQVQGAYTWSKSMDEGSGGMLGDPFGNSIPNMFWFDRRLRRGPSDFNLGQNLVINYTWNVPKPKSLQGAAGWALGGWQLGGIFQASTGLPFTPIMGGDPLGINTDDYEPPNHLATPGCASGVNPGNPNSYIKLNCFGLPVASSAVAAQCTPFAPGGTPIAGTCANLLGNAGRNSLLGPGLASFDFSLFKNNYIKRISENFNVQFRAEIFNVFNRANFLAPNDNNAIFDQTGAPIPGAGLIDGTTTTAREIQFALKLIW